MLVAPPTSPPLKTRVTFMVTSPSAPPCLLMGEVGCPGALLHHVAFLVELEGAGLVIVQDGDLHAAKSGKHSTLKHIFHNL